MPGLPFSSFRARLVLLVLTAVLPVLALAFVLEARQQRAAERRVREETEALARTAAADHLGVAELARQFLGTLAQVPEVRQGASGACDALFDRLLHAQPLYADFGLLDTGGRVVCSSLPPLEPVRGAERPIFRRVRDTSAFAVGNVELAGLPPRPAVAFGYPLLGDGGALRGVLYASVDVAFLQTLAARAQLAPGQVLLVADGRGDVLAAAPASFAESLAARGTGPPLARALAGRKGHGTAEETEPDGERRLWSVALIGPAASGAAPTLFAAAGAPLAGGRARRMPGPALVALIGLGTVLAVWGIGESLLLRPVRDLAEATTGFSTGDPGTRTGLGTEPGALGALAREFDEMADTLQRRQDETARAHQELRRSEARQSAILEGALDCVITMDGEGRIVEFNPAAEATFGYTKEQAVGQTVESLLVPPVLRETGSGPAGPLATEEEIRLRKRVERVAVRADGAEFPVEVSVTPIDGPDGPSLYTAFLRDITERRHAEEALRGARDELQRRVEARTAELKEANDRLVEWVQELQERAQDMRLLSELGDHLQACHAVDEAWAVVSQYGASLFPDEPGAVFAMSESGPLLECVAAWGEPRPAEEVFRPEDCWALRRGRPHVVEGPGNHLVCHHVGDPPPPAYVCVPLMAQGAAVGLLHLVENREHAAGGEVGPHHALAHRQLAFTIADQVALSVANLRLQEKLRDQAIRDALTGLFNRRYMQESLDRELRRAQRRRAPLGVIMLDIDHFKRFNDTFGHAAGDTLLREIGGLLQHHTRGEDIPCRYGGEEFTLILLDASPEDTEQRAEILRAEAARMRVDHAGHPLGPVTISLGVAVYPDHGEAAEDLLKAADAALYRAKAAGRDRVMIASPVA